MNNFIDVPVIKILDLETIEPGSRCRFLVHLISDGIGLPIYVPVMVAKGLEPGPVLAIVAAVHGDELNGIPVVQQIFSELENEPIKGTIIGIPVANVPGLQLMQRKFNDDVDLNHIMPGKRDGNNSELYAYRLLNHILQNVDYLLDLHTASFGRINSFYVRANMQDEENARLAHLQNAQIIVDSPAPEGTLRHYLTKQSAKAITLEVGDPNRFQRGMIRSSLPGISNVLIALNIVEGEIEPPSQVPFLCSHSFWQYTDEGGFLEVHPEVTGLIKKDQVIATLRDIFGEVIKQYKSQANGIVVGKSTHPVAQSGSRILHLGILA